MDITGRRVLSFFTLKIKWRSTESFINSKIIRPQVSLGERETDSDEDLTET